VAKAASELQDEVNPSMGMDQIVPAAGLIKGEQGHGAGTEECMVKAEEHCSYLQKGGREELKEGKASRAEAEGACDQDVRRGSVGRMLSREDGVSSITSSRLDAATTSDDSCSRSGSSSADSRSRSRSVERRKVCRRSRGGRDKKSRNHRQHTRSSSSSFRSRSRSKGRSSSSISWDQVHRAKDRGRSPLRVDHFPRAPDEFLSPVLQDMLLKHVRFCVTHVRGNRPINLGEIGNALPRTLRKAQVGWVIWGMPSRSGISSY
jgi:hypothetical protein